MHIIAIKQRFRADSATSLQRSDEFVWFPPTVTRDAVPVARHNYVHRNSLTFAQLLARLQAMREALRTVTALRSALSTVATSSSSFLPCVISWVYSRSDRRFRPSDRLLWACLRRFWPRWREALVLVQAATVSRWHREEFRGCWRPRSRRRPGWPRIDLQLRKLIGHMATENCLWGAPRIHGELLKLGIIVLERTATSDSQNIGEAQTHVADCPRFRIAATALSRFTGLSPDVWRASDGTFSTSWVLNTIRARR